MFNVRADMFDFKDAPAPTLTTPSDLAARRGHLLSPINLKRTKASSGVTIFYPSRLAVRRGRAPPALNLSRISPDHRKKAVVIVEQRPPVQIKNLEAPAQFSVHNQSLQAHVIPRKPVTGTLAGARPPPLPPRPARRSAQIIGNSPITPIPPTVNVVQEQHDTPKMSPKLSGCEKLSQILLCSPFAKTPDLLEATHNTSMDHRPKSPHLDHVQAPKSGVFLKKHRRNSMMATPPSSLASKLNAAHFEAKQSSGTEAKHLPRFDDKDLRPLVLPKQLGIDRGQRQLLHQAFFGAFLTVKRFMVGIWDDVVNGARRVQELRGCGTRTIRLTRTKKHQKQDNSMDVEKGEFVDRDVFQVQAR